MQHHESNIEFQPDLLIYKTPEMRAQALPLSTERLQTALCHDNGDRVIGYTSFEAFRFVTIRRVSAKSERWEVLTSVAVPKPPLEPSAIQGVDVLSLFDAIHTGPQFHFTSKSDWTVSEFNSTFNRGGHTEGGVQ